jgi:hypothetical protein
MANRKQQQPQKPSQEPADMAAWRRYADVISRSISGRDDDPVESSSPAPTKRAATQSHKQVDLVD